MLSRKIVTLSLVIVMMIAGFAYIYSPEDSKNMNRADPGMDDLDTPTQPLPDDQPELGVSEMPVPNPMEKYFERRVISEDPLIVILVPTKDTPDEYLPSNAITHQEDRTDISTVTRAGEPVAVVEPAVSRALYFSNYATTYQATYYKYLPYDGSASHDDDGDIVNWTWNVAVYDGTSLAYEFNVYELDSFYIYAPVLNAAPTSPIYSYGTLTVRDNEGKTGTDNNTYHHTGVDTTSPTVSPISDINIIQGETVTFTSWDASDDCFVFLHENNFTYDGELATQHGDYLWKSNDFQFNISGTYTVTFNAYDQTVWESWANPPATDTYDIIVSADIIDPVAVHDDIVMDQFTTPPLNASGCTDNGVIKWYNWTYEVDGQTYYVNTTNPVPDEVNKTPIDIPGLYVATLNITDYGGNTNETTFNITVIDRVEPDVKLVTTNLTVVEDEWFLLEGNATDNINASEELVYSWNITFLNGSVYEVIGGNITANMTVHLIADPGMYSITLEAVDYRGNVGRNTTWINVTDNTTPVANAGGDQEVPQGRIVYLNANQSTDNTWFINFTWNFTYDGDWVELYGENVTFPFDIIGDYQIRLNATDWGGHFDWDNDTWINVTTDDVVPIADPGNSTTIDQHTLYTFNGTGSWDNARIENYTWNFSYGGQWYEFYEPMFDFLFDISANYTVAFNITDFVGHWDNNESIWINVTDVDVPQTDAGAPQVVDQHTTVVLDATNTTDNRQEKGLNYTWTYQDGMTRAIQTVYDPSFEILFNNVGYYTFTLTVTDWMGNSAQDTTTVTVLDVDPPVISGVSGTTIIQGKSVSLYAGGSTDNVAIQSYSWSFTYDGSQVTIPGSTLDYTFDIAGGYDITLRVTDTSGNYATEVITVTVTADTVNPVAVAGEDVTINEGETVNFDGSASTDNGRLVDWNWNFTYEGSPVTYSGDTASHQFDVYGVYTVTLTVTDVADNTHSDSLTVTVNDITNPTAEANGPYSIDLGGTVTLDSSGSSDNSDDAGALSYEWTYTYDGTAKTLTGAGPTSEHTFDISGDSITVTLTVSDVSGNTATDTATITVGADNTNPTIPSIADITINQHEDATFDATGISDDFTDAGDLDVTWSFTYGGTAQELTGVTATFTFDDAGTYPVTVTVADESANSASVTFNVNVLDITDPVADAGDDQSVKQGTTVTFNAKDSSDNVEIATYSWSFDYGGSSETLTGMTGTFKFDEVGVYTVILTVTDAAGNSAQDTMTVTVTDDQKPVAKISVSPDGDVPQNTEVNLGAEDSTDNVGIVNYTWVIKKGTTTVDTLTGANVTFSFPEVGDYKVELTVDDASGNEATATVIITVLDGIPPVVDAGEDREVDQFDQITLDGSKTTDNHDTAGDLTFTWTFEYDGEEQSLDGEKPKFTFDIVGEYDITLTVEDRAGNSDSAGMTITVVVKIFTVEIGPFEFTDGTPIVGMEVILSPGTRADDEWTSETDENGYATFDIPAGSYDGEASHEGEDYTFAITVEGPDGNVEYDEEIPAIAKPETNMAVTMPAILDEDGNPVEGATVTVTIDGVDYQAFTGADGVATVNIPKDAAGKEMDVEVTSPDHETIYFKATAPASEDGGNAEPQGEVPSMESVPSEDEGEDDGDSSLMMWIILIIVIVVVVVVVLLIVMKKKKDDDDEQQPPEMPPEDGYPQDQQQFMDGGYPQDQQQPMDGGYPQDQQQPMDGGYPQESQGVYDEQYPAVEEGLPMDVPEGDGVTESEVLPPENAAGDAVGVEGGEEEDPFGDVDGEQESSPEEGDGEDIWSID